MAGEQVEELGLIVSLDDSASAQLEQLKQNLGGLREIAKIEKSTLDLGNEFKELTEQLLEGQKALLDYVRSAGWAGFGLVALEKYATDTTKLLTELTAELTDMDQAANVAGIAVGQLRVNAEAFERAGFSLAAGVKQWTKWVETFGESQLQFSEFWRKLYSHVKAGTPEAQRLDRLRREMQGVSPEEGFNLFKAYTDEIKAQLDKRSPLGGAQEQARMFKDAGLDPRARFVEQLHVLSAKQIELEKRRAKAVADFRVASTKLDQQVTAIKRSLAVNTMARLIIPILRLTKTIPRLDKVAKNRKANWFQVATPTQSLMAAFWKLFSAEPAGDETGRESKENPPPQPKAPDLKEQLGKGDLDKLTPEILRGGMSLKDMQQQRLLGAGEARDEGRNAGELSRLHALLLGPPQGLGGTPPEFHNQPMGGAAGESNPIKLPPGVSQPGGGAAAEASDWPNFDTRTGRPIIRGSWSNILKAQEVGRAAGPTTMLGAQRAGQRVYTFEEVQKSMELLAQFGGHEFTKDVEEGLYGISQSSSISGWTGGMAFNPNLSAAPAVLGHEATHIGRSIATAAGRSDPNIFKRYGFMLDQGPQNEEIQQRIKDFEITARLKAAGLITAEGAKDQLEQAQAWLNMEKLTTPQLLEFRRHEAMVDAKAREMLGETYTPPAPLSSKDQTPIITYDPARAPTRPRGTGGKIGAVPLPRPRPTQSHGWQRSAPLLDDALAKEIRQSGEGEVNVKVQSSKQDSDEIRLPPYKDTGTEVPTRAQKAAVTTNPVAFGEFPFPQPTNDINLPRRPRLNPPFRQGGDISAGIENRIRETREGAGEEEVASRPARPGWQPIDTVDSVSRIEDRRKAGLIDKGSIKRGYSPISGPFATVIPPGGIIQKGEWNTIGLKMKQLEKEQAASIAEARQGRGLGHEAGLSDIEKGIQKRISEGVAEAKRNDPAEREPPANPEEDRVPPDWKPPGPIEPTDETPGEGTN